MPALFETLPSIEGMVAEAGDDPNTAIIKFVIDPDHPLTVERFEQAMRDLADMTTAQGLQFGAVFTSTPVTINVSMSGTASSAMLSLSGIEARVTVPWKFVVATVLARPYQPSRGTHHWGIREGGSPDPFGTIRALDAFGSTHYPTCEWCYRGSPQLFRDMDRLFCPNCAGVCPAPHSFPEYIAPFAPMCADHAPNGVRELCCNCGVYLPDGGDYYEYWGDRCCDDCAPGICPGCGRETLDRYGDLGVCERCYYDGPEFYDDEELSFDTPAPSADWSPPPYMTPRETEAFEDEGKTEADLLIPTIPGRENVRTCGLEIEGGGSGRALARALHAAGLSNYDRQLNYHTQSELSQDGMHTWTVENDSSVDWELISPPLNIADREHVRELHQAVDILRTQIKEGVVGLDLRCGLHVHIGAEQVGITHAYHLGKVWGYLEDVIFRLGAARWPYHRSIMNGLHYCQPTPKGAKTKLEFGRQMDNNMDRYNALSFQNYIQSFTRRCQCGAVRYDSWDECTCSLGKCTFEFRVFNTSANMHKIHAYLALCQALVAWATGRDEIDPDALPEQSYVNRQVDALTPAHTDAWKERLEFIFNELPLTEGEKRDLLYCVQHSELNTLGSEFIDALPLNAQEVVA